MVPWSAPALMRTTERALLDRRRVGDHGTVGTNAAPRRAFTLFEVSLSLALVSFGVISVLMLFPTGIRAQQLSRFQIYAAAKAEEMVESFNTSTNANPAIDTEGLMPWDTAGAYRAQAWDLEARLSSHRFGIMPLPADLVRRIDSDNDEIHQIISQGGYIYYSQPLATTETEEQGNPQSPPNDAQKLIFAVSGYAQQNALHMFAMKDWPYSTPMPSPPLNISHMPDIWLPPNGNQAGGGYWSYHSWPSGEDYDVPWETVPSNLDPDMQIVYDYPLVAGGTHIGYFPYACGNGTHFPDGVTGTAPCMFSALGYAQAAVWYFEKKVGSSYADVFTPATVASLDPHAPFVSTVETDRWKEVQAFRFLSHAATTLTSWFSYQDADPTHMDLGTKGVTIPPATIRGFTSSGPGGNPIVIWDADLRYYHERAIYLAMQFYAMYPYDWSVPRSTNRTIMTDYPLIMSDLWSPPLQGSVFGTSPAQPAAQWRPVSAEPIQHIGVSQMFPINNLATLDAAMKQGSSPSSVVNGTVFGNIDHFTLAAPFAPAERCRELVFWTADWQTYEDFETLPSAPVDASKYPLSAPRCSSGGAVPYTPQRNFAQRMGDIQFRDEQLWAFRNPEKCMLFTQNVTGLAAGTSTSAMEILNNPWAADPDQGSSSTQESVFSGMYGADRNFNQQLDRGALPKSARIHAQLVARFNFYDPRVPAVLR